MGKTNRKKFGELLNDLGKRHTDPDKNENKSDIEQARKEQNWLCGHTNGTPNHIPEQDL